MTLGPQTSILRGQEKSPGSFDFSWRGDALSLLVVGAGADAQGRRQSEREVLLQECEGLCACLRSRALLSLWFDPES